MFGLKEWAGMAVTAYIEIGEGVQVVAPVVIPGGKSVPLKFVHHSTCRLSHELWVVTSPHLCPRLWWTLSCLWQEHRLHNQEFSNQTTLHLDLFICLKRKSSSQMGPGSSICRYVLEMLDFGLNYTKAKSELVKNTVKKQNPQIVKLRFHPYFSQFPPSCGCHVAVVHQQERCCRFS